MSRLYCCTVCDTRGTWQVMRRGDVITEWACNEHLAAIADGMQRDFEVTELVVKHLAKAHEWGEIRRILETTIDPEWGTPR